MVGLVSVIVESRSSNSLTCFLSLCCYLYSLSLSLFVFQYCLPLFCLSLWQHIPGGHKHRNPYSLGWKHKRDIFLRKNLDEHFLHFYISMMNYSHWTAWVMCLQGIKSFLMDGLNRISWKVGGIYQKKTRPHWLPAHSYKSVH